MTHPIRTLGPDETISEPGFYQISLDRHHAQPCDGPSVTSGVLRKMELESPADVWAFHMLNPDRWEKPQTAALRLGRAMAAYVEGGMEAVAQHFAVLPEDKPGKPTAKMLEDYGSGIDLSCYEVLPVDAPRRPTSKQIVAVEAGGGTDTAKAAVEFWREAEVAGKSFVTQSEIDRLHDVKNRVEFWKAVDADPRDKISAADQKMIEDMGKVLARDPGAVAAMGGIPEVTMAWKDERTGLWLLSRPDTVSFDGMMTDYKKLNTQGRPFNHGLIDRRITEHGYDMQMAFAADVFESLTGNRPEIVAIVGQWDQPPHHVIIREILDEDLRMASFLNRRAIDRFAECLASGYWPGPGDDVGYYRRPEWRRDQILQQMNTEGTAP